MADMVVSYFRYSLFMGLLLSLMTLCSCSSDEVSDDNRAEFAKIAENRAAQDLLNDLFIGSDGDVESLARMLNVTPSTIDRIRKGKTEATPKFEEKIKEVTKFYYQNDQSFIKLRSVIDEEWGWYDSVLKSYKLHPYWFWGITLFLIVSTLFWWLSQTVLSVITILYLPGCLYNFTIGMYGLILEGIVFLIAFICSIYFSPSPMEDQYADTINPVVEQMI